MRKDKPFESLSPALKLVDLVWRESFSCTPHSWRVYNDTLSSALALAIASGMHFDVGDFEYIDNNYKFCYWCGNDGHMSGEGFYSRAVNNMNSKAIQSFEAWKSRKPFIFVNVLPTYTWGYERPMRRKPCRLTIGSGFRWKGEDVQVTSFSEDGTYIIACSYKNKGKQRDPKDYESLKILHRYNITNRELASERQRLKKVAKIKAAVNMSTMFWQWVADLIDMTFPGDKKTDHAIFGMFVIK